MSDAPSTAPTVRFTLDARPTDASGDAHAGVAPDARPEGSAGAAPRTVVLRGEGEEVVIEAARRLTLRVGASALTLDADGTILLHGVRVMVAADESLTAYAAGAHTIRGATVDIN